MGRALIELGEYQDLPARALKQETCEKYGYFVAKDDKGPVQVAPYRHRKTGQVIGQKVRGANKRFYTTGDFKEVGLFGQHLFRDGGKRVLIVEGEIDALSAHQMLGTWPVVSVPNGAQGAAKAIAANIAWLEGYERVVFCFDNDEPGREATQDCVRLLSPGRACVMDIPLKDPNEMLVDGRIKEFVSAFWEAKEYRPDGIVRLSDIRDKILNPPEVGLSWWSPTLTKLTYGRRWGETYAFGAGTGIGKTDFLTQQIEHDVDVLGLKVGLFFLEQPPGETVKRVAGKFAGKRFHVPDGSWTQEELEGIVDRLVEQDRIYLYDNFGAADWETIKGHIKYLHHAYGVRIFYLDHLTALAAAEEDEKEALERIMADMAQLAMSLQVIIHFVSHLATPDGTPHEEGGRVKVRHFKGSRAIGYWSHFMFALERDTQAEDLEERQTTVLRPLKDRLTGQANGELIYLGYEVNTGRLFETTAPDDGLSDVEGSQDF